MRIARLLAAALCAAGTLAGTSQAASGPGAAIWASAGCGGCHSLRAAGSTGTAGPDLDALAPSPGQVAEQVISGGGGMPSFSGRLTTTEIAVVARYVYDATHGTTTPPIPARPAPLPAPSAAAARRLQRDLAALGLYAGPVTGVIGPLTSAAIRRFQASAGLAVDGKAGPATLAAIAARLAPAVQAAQLPKPTAAVRLLQQRLAALGYFTGPATGVYGPVTTAAVKRFQAASGLVVDGKWGPASQAALDRAG
jgi:peptidoglycan hydrolase-like protein with peptidoglycan-binding domain